LKGKKQHDFKKGEGEREEKRRRQSNKKEKRTLKQLLNLRLRCATVIEVLTCIGPLHSIVLIEFLRESRSRRRRVKSGRRRGKGREGTHLQKVLSSNSISSLHLLLPLAILLVKNRLVRKWIGLQSRLLSR